jgi:hypothetical protein
MDPLNCRRAPCGKTSSHGAEPVLSPCGQFPQIEYLIFPCTLDFPPFGDGLILKLDDAGGTATVSYYQDTDSGALLFQETLGG